MTRLIAIASAVILAGLITALLVLTSMKPGADLYAACRTSSIAGGVGAIGGPFSLVNGKGQTVTDQDVVTKPSLIYFGYTFCPDVCPADAARNAETIDLLDEKGVDVTPVFISIDPERDTPEVVDEYASYLHERMIGLTGSAQQVKAASQAYKTYYRKQEAEDEFYLMDHSTFTYLVLPEVGFVDFFRRDIPAEKLAQQVACFVNAT